MEATAKVAEKAAAAKEAKAKAAQKVDCDPSIGERARCHVSALLNPLSCRGDGCGVKATGCEQSSGAASATSQRPPRLGSGGEGQLACFFWLATSAGWRPDGWRGSDQPMWVRGGEKQRHQ